MCRMHAAVDDRCMNITLIAMSGIRVQDPELQAMGMTLPGFVERGKAIASLPSLGLLTLAALTPEHHDISYLEVADLSELPELPQCDVAAFSTFTAQANEAYRLSERFRQHGVLTVLGGLFATAAPEDAMPHFDAVVVGEGEPIWAQVLSDAEGGRLQPRYDAPKDFDLADGPLPRYDLLDPADYNRLTVQTTRGCPWRCSFCAGSILLTPKYKQKPVAHVVREIRAIQAIWPRPFIEFADDNTFVDKKRSRELVGAIGELGVRWFTETDISLADDEELLRMLSDAGCAEVLIGLESPSDPALAGIELRRDWKRTQGGRYAEAVEKIQSYGVAVNACFVLGLDGAGPDAFDLVETFVDEVHPFDVQITLQTPLPGTPLYAQMLAQRRLLSPGDWDHCTLFDITYQPRGITVEELRTGFRELAQRLYSEEATRRRRAGFLQTKRDGRKAHACMAV